MATELGNGSNMTAFYSNADYSSPIAPAYEHVTYLATTLREGACRISSRPSECSHGVDLCFRQSEISFGFKKATVLRSFGPQGTANLQSFELRAAAVLQHSSESSISLIYFAVICRQEVVLALGYLNHRGHAPA